MVVRKRLIFWLIRAYIKKSGKTIIFSFLAGLIIFFVFLFSSRYFAKIVPIHKKEIIGVTGTYTTDNLPNYILKKISKGLTSVESNGEIKPSIASSWQILDSGKTYIFHLKKDQYLSDGREITSDLVNYNFSDVQVDRPDKYTIIFKLKQVYSPFLVTVSRPILLRGLIGSGDYKIDDIKLNGNFIQNLTISSIKDRFDINNYIFYSSIDVLKYAYLLGEVNYIEGLNDTNFRNYSFYSFPNTIVNKKTNYNKLVTIFYNNDDAILNDKKVRLALSYSLPDSYAEGEKAFLPYSPKSIYFNTELAERKQNFTHAKLLLSASNTASGSAEEKNNLKLSIKTAPKYTNLAKNIAKNFSKIGFQTDVKNVDSVPNEFQIFIGDYNLSSDPDQYSLWHSDQTLNITKYKNLRIDKLLEDGRKTIDFTLRQKIYYDFQRFLTDDVPASFLYFPYEYEIIRK